MRRKNWLGRAAVLSACIFMAGCSGKARQPEERGNTAREEETEYPGGQADGRQQPRTDIWQGETEHIIMTFLTLNSDVDDLDEVMEAVNDISVPRIGVEVEARVVDSSEADTQFYLWLGNGEPVDLMMLMYQDVTSYITKGLLTPVDDLFEKQAPHIKDLIEREGFPLTTGSYVQGRAYGITCVPSSYGNSGGITFKKEYLDKAGIVCDEDRIYSLDDMTEIFRVLKETFPDQYPLGQITAGNRASTFPYYGGIVDALGSDSTSGVVMGTRSTEVVNLYATQEYYEFLEYLREWYLEGYIYPDAAITDTRLYGLIQEKLVLGVPLSGQPGLQHAYFDGDTVCFQLSQIYSSAPYAKSSFWTIPSTSGHPEAAMRFLDLMFGDPQVGNLLQWGIEGKHYEVTDEENGLIRCLMEDGGKSSGFLNPLGLYGDQRKIYQNCTLEFKRKIDEYSQKAIQNPFVSNGFSYYPVERTREIAEIQKVVEKYVPILESGSVELDIYYPKFLRELEQAGMEEVTALKQEAFDAWLLKQNDVNTENKRSDLS